MVKIYLDDWRQPFDSSWLVATTAKQCISLLEEYKNEVSMLSLDHDLGPEITCGNGYDVLVWIENKINQDQSYNAPTWIGIHTANPVAKERMRLAVLSIKNIMKSR